MKPHITGRWRLGAAAAGYIGSPQIKDHSVHQWDIAFGKDRGVRWWNINPHDLGAGRLSTAVDNQLAQASQVSGYQLVFGGTKDVDAGAVANVTTACPTGKVVLGGGYQTNGGFTVMDSAPAKDGAGWYVQAKNTQDNGNQIQTWAICAAGTAGSGS